MNRDDLPRANATCKVCGRPYYICKQCERMRSGGLYSWKFDADTHECFQVFLVLKDYREGKLSKEKAREQLDTARVLDIGTLAPDTRALVDEIMHDPAPELMGHKNTVSKVPQQNKNVKPDKYKPWHNATQGNKTDVKARAEN